MQEACEKRAARVLLRKYIQTLMLTIYNLLDIMVSYFCVLRKASVICAIHIIYSQSFWCIHDI